MPFKCSFKAQCPRMYMLFGTRNPNLGSILKPEVELMVFLRMRSNKITKNGENAIKMQFQSQISASIYVFWYEESEFEVYFETGSRINGVLRMRSGKITKNGEKCLKMQF